MTTNGDAIKIIILMKSHDTVEVSGPLANKVLCMGMLERAKDAVREFRPSQIIPAAIVQNIENKLGDEFRKDKPSSGH